METPAAHRTDPAPSGVVHDERAQAAVTPLPEARISEAQLQAARRIVEREVRELRVQLARDAEAEPRAERPS